MKAFDWLSSGARLMSWFHQLSPGKSVRPLKSSLRATPTDGAEGVPGVLGPLGVVGSDESFSPPQAAIVMADSASAVVSSRRRFDVTRSTLRQRIGLAFQPDYSTVAVRLYNRVDVG
jgi:hypothetical protein